MPENTMQPEDKQAYKSLLYWRKSLMIGSQCVPVILTLKDDTLTMKTADDAVVFTVPKSQLSVKFTGWGTMLLTIGEKRYDIVGVPAAESPDVSESQIAELSQIGDGSDAKESTKATALNAVATSTIASGAPGAIGAAASTSVYYRGLTSIREWKVLIGSAADQKRKLNYMTYFIAFVIIALIIAIALK